jgi:hypothetical protein
MSKKHRVLLIVLIASIVGNILWIEHLLALNFNAYTYFDAFIMPKIEAFLPSFLEIWIHLVIGFVVFPFITWLAPFLCFCVLASRFNPVGK